MLRTFYLALFTTTPGFMILSVGVAADKIMKHDVEKVKGRRALLARVSLFPYVRRA
jgi:hypothetical protein